MDLETAPYPPHTFDSLSLNTPEDTLPGKTLTQPRGLEPTRSLTRESPCVPSSGGVRRWCKAKCSAIISNIQAR